MMGEINGSVGKFDRKLLKDLLSYDLCHKIIPKKVTKQII